MPKQPLYRLRIVIPLLLCMGTIMINGYQTVSRLNDTREFFVDNTRQTLGFKMHGLQGIVSDMLLNGNRTRVEQTLANAVLDHQIVTLLLTDENDRILSANRREWLTASAQRVTRYDAVAAGKARNDQSSALLTLPGQLFGYYPVVLPMRRGELRPQHFGMLYVEYDYSAPLARAEQRVYADAVKLLSFSILLSLLFLLGLHFLVTKRVERLLIAMKAVSKGNLDSRSGLHGHGEIDQLAQTFDQMTAELAAKQRDLHEQAAELEQEMAERQMAQEGLEEQTVLLEEEIVERIKIEESLKEVSLFNQQVINGAREGIVVYDRSLRYLAWNPFMEELSGIKAEEVLGRHPLELFPFLVGTGVLQNLENVLAGEQGEEREYPFHILQSGKSGWVSHTSAPLRDLKGDVIGVIATVRDMTFHKKTEEQLRQSQKMEAVGQLAGGIAHDFNNILTVVIACSEMLRCDASLSSPQANHANQILAAAERAAQLTRGLLAFSRKQVMTPRVLDLNEIVQRAQKFLARVVGEDMQLKTICNRTDLKVKVDAGQMEQVLTNLVTNARDAMPNGGTLLFETDRQEVTTLPELEEGLSAGSYAVVSVTDTGLGMDKDTMKMIFEPFFTTKEPGKGTGLGMSMVQGIISQHGGFVRVSSEPGKGTCFRIYLPLIKEDPVPVGEGSDALAPPKGGNETVLIAEDDAEIRSIFGSLLSEYGYRVILAEDGESAVEKFRSNEGKIKLLILDIVMPKMNGVEVNAEIRKLQPSGVTTLYSTGYAKDIIQRRGELAASEDIIIKPVRPMELLRKVRELLDREQV